MHLSASALSPGSAERASLAVSSSAGTPLPLQPFRKGSANEGSSPGRETNSPSVPSMQNGAVLLRMAFSLAHSVAEGGSVTA